MSSGGNVIPNSIQTVKDMFNMSKSIVTRKPYTLMILLVVTREDDLMPVLSPQCNLLDW